LQSSIFVEQFTPVNPGAHDGNTVGDEDVGTIEDDTDSDLLGDVDND